MSLRGARFRGLVVLNVFLIVACSRYLNGQAAQDVPKSTDLQFHKFQPKVAPDRAIPSSAKSGQAIDGVGAYAAQQMQSLQEDKAARTPAQRKIDSNLIYTTRMLAGQPAAPGVPYLYTGVELDEKNNVVVDMVANVTNQLLKQLTAAGAQVL